MTLDVFDDSLKRVFSGSLFEELLIADEYEVLLCAGQSNVQSTRVPQKSQFSGWIRPSDRIDGYIGLSALYGVNCIELHIQSSTFVRISRKSPLQQSTLGCVAC